MVLDNHQPRDGRTLLGLRPPAELAEGPIPQGPAAPPEPQLVQAGAPPPRPTYTVVSSGWDSEDQESRGKGSDLATALRAGAVLIVFLVAVALLLR
jgi:hypothetical protein